MTTRPSPPGEAAVALRLLGAPRLLRDSASVPISSAKALAVLSYLALTERPQTRDRLLLLLWPESAEAAARKNLRNTLWTIRTGLGDDLIVAEGDRLALNPRLAVDALALRALHAQAQAQELELAQLQAALALYGGALLDGLLLSDAPEFELWLSDERERLLQQYSFLAAALLARQRALGDWEGLERAAQQTLSHSSLHEEAHRALMEALARRGDRAAALRQYERLRATLGHELGATPLPETEAVYAAILSGQLAPATAPAPSPAPPRRAAAPEGGPLIGREAALAALDAARGAAAQGRLRLIVLSGELGIGKSYLWQRWAEGLPESTRVEARCLEATQQMPFAPLVALFSSAAWDARAASSVGAGLPPWLQALARLLPSRAELSARPLIGGAAPAEDRQLLFEAFAQALLATSQAPHTLFVDNLQWADSTTLDWLEYAIHRLRDAPLLLVLAYRGEDAPRDLVRRLASWERGAPTERLALPRLSAAEADALLEARGIPPEARAHIARESAGNPYFLTELARAGGAELPVALADLVRARVEGLPDAARQVLQAACVSQPDSDLDMLMQVGALDQEATLEALDTLLAGGLLVEQEERYRFGHPLVATVVRAALGRARRGVLHRRAAAALAQSYAEHLPAWSGRIAAHYHEAGDRRQAARYAALAGDYALSVAAVAEAVAFYRRALAEEASPERQLALARALIWHGEQDEALSLLQTARAAFLAQEDRGRAGLALLVQADLALTRGGYEEAGRLAEQALGLSGEGEPFTTAAAHILIGTAARARGELEAAQQHLDIALRLGRQHQLRDILVYGSIGLSNVRAERGDLEGALAAARDLVQAAREAGNGFYQIVGHNNAAFRATQLGAFAEAHAQIAAGLELADRHGLEMPRQWLYSTRGELALAEQRWDEAEAWFARALAEAERRANPEQLAMSRANLGRAALGRGETQRAVEQLREAYERGASAAQYQHLQIGLWLAQALLHAEQHPAAQQVWHALDAQLAQRSYPALREQAEQLARALGLPA